MKTANLAIVFTELLGFAERASQQTLEQSQGFLALYQQLLGPLFEAFGGRVVKEIGGTFLVTFESPTSAVLSGVAIQDRLWAHNRAADEAHRLSVRVAINVGEVRLEKSDVYGEPVNIAARVESIAVPGEVTFTEAVYLSMSRAEVPAEELGAFELKGIPGRIKLYKVPRAPYHVEASAPASTSSDSQPPFGNLGLVRVSEQSLVASTQTEPLREELKGRARELGRRAASLGLSFRTLALAAVAVAIGLGLWALKNSPIESAMRAVEAAPEAERPARIAAAQRLMAQLKDPGQREYYAGRLDDAIEEPESAAAHYRSAAHLGEGRAIDELVEDLESEECRVRELAAFALGELKVTRAKSRLEELAKSGGPDESALPVFGCNSRAAALGALKKMK